MKITTDELLIGIIRMGGRRDRYQKAACQAGYFQRTVLPAQENPD